MDKERRIEKLLRAFAKKRKADAGAPLEMHPATRRLLQGEVARRLKTRPTTEQAWWRIWFGTPRRAFAVCALVSIIISGTVFLTTMKKSGPTMSLAKNENRAQAGKPNAGPIAQQELQRAPEATPSAPGMPAPASPAPPPVTVTMADRKDGDTGLTRGGGGRAGGFSGFGLATTPPANASALPAAYDYIATNDTSALLALNGPAPAGTAMEKSFSTSAIYKDTLSLTNSFQAGAAGEGTRTATPALDTEKQFIAEAKAPESNISTLNFASGSRFENVGALAAKSEIPAQQFYRLRAMDKTDGAKEKSRALGVVKKLSAGDVLDSFSVTQDGNKITVVDSDGSQYTGFMQPVTISGSLEDVPVAAPVATGQMAPGQRAAGTLMSAGAYNTVTFDSSAAQNFDFKVTGTNLSLKQLVVFSGHFVALTNGVVTRNGLVTNVVASDAFGPRLGLQNSRIEGRATVGGKKTPVEIKATPVNQ